MSAEARVLPPKQKQPGSDTTPAQLERFVMAASEAGYPPKRVRHGDDGVVCASWFMARKMPKAVEVRACELCDIPTPTIPGRLAAFCVDDNCPDHPAKADR